MQTGNERLLFLAQKLREDAANKKGIKFDLNTWAIHNPGFWDFLKSSTSKFKINCNTQGCAIGLAGMLSEFNTLGFKIDKISSSSFLAYPVYLDPFGNYFSGWSAVRKFFEIDYKTAEYLFESGSYTKTRGAEAEVLVAERIEQVVADRLSLSLGVVAEEPVPPLAEDPR